MFRNYFKTAWRNLIKNRGFSFINISGLAVGMGVTMLIGLWIWSELSFNKNFENYPRIAQVMQNQTFNGVTGSQRAIPYLMGDELRKTYGSDFRYVTMCTWTGYHTLSYGDKQVSKGGNFFEPPVIRMLSLKMIRGNASALNDDHSVILSASTATALFSHADPLGKMIKVDDRFTLKVSGVYQDLPDDCSFNELQFIAPWKLFIDNNSWPEKLTNPWRSNAFQTYVQLADNVDMNKVSAKIRDIKLKNVTKEDAAFKPVVFLHPMSRWHLYDEFKNGVNTGGKIAYVRMFGIIGLFVLLLACINFMNLSTARSEKRAKEVGIRKAIGSPRRQLIGQFFSESLLIAFFAFVLSLILVQLTLPAFNELAGKKITISWSSPLFWLLCISFCGITGLIAGSYPALYLSSFRPVRVLKGSFRTGQLASLPRKALVVAQFFVSVALITGTIVVFRQIQYAKDRPVGYSQNGLISVSMRTNDIHKHFEAVRDELMSSGTVSAMAESAYPVTDIYEVDNGFEWAKKDPSVQGNFSVNYTTFDYGKTVGWKLKKGRDFSRDFPTDSTGMILNESAAKFINLPQPVGETIRWDGKPYHVIGVVKDMVIGSPYDPAFRMVYVLDNGASGIVNIRISPAMGTHQALDKIQAVFKKYDPAQPFEYKFVDKQYAQKFGDEERIGKLATVFAFLAIFISCLGLFGMASFMAEQRTKEIGIRKVLGATVVNLCTLLSKDFLVLVLISCGMAIPVSWYVMHHWLQNYEYRRAGIPIWIFAATAGAAVLITLATVSFQAIKAAIANPVKALRSE